MLIFRTATSGWMWCHAHAVGDCSFIAYWGDGDVSPIRARKLTWIDDVEDNEGSGRLMNALANGIYGRYEVESEVMANVA